MIPGIPTTLTSRAGTGYHRPQKGDRGMGTTRRYAVLDPATGKTLWHLNMGGPLLASPMTYMLDGRQYLMIPIYDTLYAFVLPPKSGN